MLELKNIYKTYHVGEIETKALVDVSIAFREQEFVAILGKSGSGKTTCLNILGGLDRYDQGELTIKGKKTSDFKDRDWDAYRNNSIGFVFQSYQLIMHQSIVANVELGMTLSGVSAKQKRKRALEVLTLVGLQEHLHKKPSQLSGGQMQRVAIARALANDPEILLCDEPTGALDTTTSKQIMDLIQSLSKKRLVIMVTHNPEIAATYADRIIEFEDGRVKTDSNPYHADTTTDKFTLRHTSMSFWTALNLSFHNIRTKKGRTFLTSFASSIGIIGIAVILSLSTGFQMQIDDFQRNALAEFPIIISKQAASLNPENFENMRENREAQPGTDRYAATDAVYLYDPSALTMIHQNKLTKEYIDYINAIDPELVGSIGYTRLAAMNVLRKVDGVVQTVQFAGLLDQRNASAMSSVRGMGMSAYPDVRKPGDLSYLEKNYDLMAGSYPQKITDVVLVIDERNRVPQGTMKVLGFDAKQSSIAFADLLPASFQLISNDVYYQKTMFGTFMPSQDLTAMFDEKSNVTVNLVGVVRKKEDVEIGLLGTGIAYSDALTQLVIDRAIDSEIVQAQKESDHNVITMEAMDEAAKEQFLAYLGGDAGPYMMMLFPDDFQDKEEVLAYLDAYNEGKELEHTVIYTDLAGTMSDMTGGIMNGITIVLIAFAAISLVVSLIMIGIITYTSVLERTKEIGILRALGARKKDIARVFDAETCILGISSGVLGIAIAYLLTIPINSLVYRMTSLVNVSVLRFDHALLLIAISTILTMLGGHIPAKMASKKDAVEALRSE